MADLITFDQWLDLFDRDSERISVVKNFMRVIVQTADPSQTEPALKHVGSSYMRGGNVNNFYEVLAHKSKKEAEETLFKSDYDFAIPVDTFLLDSILRVVPNFKLKDEEENYGYGAVKQRFLKQVYEASVRDLLTIDESMFAMAIGKTVREFSFIDLPTLIRSEKFQDQKVQLLLVKNLPAYRQMWDNIPRKTFAKFYWKHSPTFIGKEALSETFATFEELASGAFDKKPKINLKERIGQALGFEPVQAVNAFPVPDPVQPEEVFV